jgi:DNA-binding IclR family transcriptional regulator
MSVPMPAMSPQAGRPPVTDKSIPIASSPQLLERTIVVLQLFTPEQREWTVTEIGRACGLAVPTVHRIVSTLHRHGFLARHELTKRYWLGPAMVRLGRTATMTIDLRGVSQPVLRRISLRTKETALLTVVSESGRHATCLERIESIHPLRLSVQAGREMPLHAGASQKILLAHMPPADVERVLNEPLQALCASTITDPATLRTELGVIRRRGWSASCEETNRGIWGLAVGLIDEHGNPVAAIGVAGPSERRPHSLAPWLAMLSDGAGEIATELGLRSSLTLVPVAGQQPALQVRNHRHPVPSCG